MGESQALPNINRPSRAFEEIASWRLATELMRRFPKRFKIIEMHAGGGLYDSLALISVEGSVNVHINRGGSVVVESEGRDKRPWDAAWPQALLTAQDMRACVDDICEVIGWPVPDPLPSTTRHIITYRFMAEFLTHTCLGRRHWEWRNGFADTSGYGGGVRSHWFAQFQEAQKSARRHDQDDVLGIPEYRFWFLVRPHKLEVPALCLETTGVAFRKDGQSEDLYKLYKERRRIWPLIMSVIPELLP